MGIRLHACTLATAPALALFIGSPEERAQQGTVLVYHGFGESKETGVPILRRLKETASYAD